MNVGVDEAGRGCVFGAVYAAAVIWNDEIVNEYIKDSKKLTKKRRQIMFDFVKEHAIDYGIGFATAKEIDELNILQATQLAMHRAIDYLTVDFDHIYVDGNCFNYYYSQNSKEYKQHTCIIKGDSLVKSISAASILAKVSHDNYIEEISEQYKNYNIDSNMGYCTQKHIDAIQKYGRTFEHRHTFKMPFEKHVLNYG
jgi:ribonuclease HII